MVTSGILKALIDLISVDAAEEKFVQTLVLKTLSVLMYFDETHQRAFAQQGLLRPILALLRSGTPQIKAQVLDIVPKFRGTPSTRTANNDQMTD